MCSGGHHTAGSGLRAAAKHCYILLAHTDHAAAIHPLSAPIAVPACAATHLLVCVQHFSTSWRYVSEVMFRGVCCR